jgi:hypothetical protein
MEIAPAFCSSALFSLTQIVAMPARGQHQSRLHDIGAVSSIAGNNLHRPWFGNPIAHWSVSRYGPIPASAANIHSPARIGAFIYGSAAQPLTQIHKVNLAVYQARLGISLAKEGLRAQQQETARQVKEAYYQVAQLQAQVARSSSEKLAFNDVEVGVSDS